MKTDFQKRLECAVILQRVIDESQKLGADPKQIIEHAVKQFTELRRVWDAR